MYKAKIIKILNKSTYQVEIPSIGISTQAHLICDKGYSPLYSTGDLVIVSELNTGEYIILGVVFIDN